MTALKIIERPASPEDDLRLLLRQLAEQERAVAETRAAIREPMRRYAAKHGLKMLPRIETIRALLSDGGKGW